MTSDEALNHFEKALGADARPSELQDESHMVAAMVDAIAVNASPPAAVLSLERAPKARARGRRRVASVVAVAVLCTTSVAAATGGISTPDLIDWSNFFPNLVNSEPDTPDESDPRFELGDVEVPIEDTPTDEAEPADSEAPANDDGQEPVDDTEDDPSPEPGDEVEEIESEPDDTDDRKGGPSEEKREEAEDRKGGPSEDKRDKDWKNLENEKDENGKSESNRANENQDNKQGQGEKGDTGNSANAAKKNGSGETGEGHEGNKTSEANKKQPNGKKPTT